MFIIIFYILLPTFTDKLSAANRNYDTSVISDCYGFKWGVCLGMLFMQSNVKKSKGPRIDLWKRKWVFIPHHKKS